MSFFCNFRSYLYFLNYLFFCDTHSVIEDRNDRQSLSICSELSNYFFLIVILILDHRCLIYLISLTIGKSIEEIKMFFSNVLLFGKLTSNLIYIEAIYFYDVNFKCNMYNCTYIVRYIYMT